MTTDTHGWTIWSGEQLTHDSDDGNISLKGAAKVLGPVDGIAAISASCIDVTRWVHYARFKAEGSVKPSGGTTGKTMAEIDIHRYADKNCTKKIDTVVRNKEAEPGKWTAVTGDFALVAGSNSIRIVVAATGMPKGSNVMFDDVSLTIGRDALEIFKNHDMTENTDGWILHWGYVISHNTHDGHLTPNGSIRTVGDANGWEGAKGLFTGIRSACIDLTDRAPLDQYRVAASSKPDSDATDPEMGIHVDYYSDTDCETTFGRSLFFGEAKPSKWSRLEGTFVPPEGTKAITVIIRSSGLSADGGATFDDMSLSLTQAVRQLWLIGVGDIDGRTIKSDDMQYTRGGAFGGNFNPASIRREGFVNLEIEFDGCNSGKISFKGEDFKGAYPVSRLAANESVSACEDRGFQNMSSDNGWMSGYWFGNSEKDGEGFVIDVLQGGQQAVVTWYTYQPTWGVDAPR